MEFQKIPSLTKPFGSPWKVRESPKNSLLTKLDQVGYPIAYTGYKGHFTWLVKSWCIGGKIVKNQHFISLYQLWKNQIILYFPIGDISWYNQIVSDIWGIGQTWENLIIQQYITVGKSLEQFNFSMVDTGW